jgi:carboxypeptidase family protein
MKVDARFQQLRSSCCRSILSAVVFVLAGVSAIPSAHAQSTGGRIRGTVVDPSGGAVPAATVQLVNEGTHATREVQTGANGEYIFIEAPVGSYEIDLTLQGFKKYVRKGIVLDLNQVLTIDIALQLGGSTDVVEVTGVPPVVDTTSTQLGAVMNSVAVSELPLNTRDTYQLLQLQPGVQSQLGSNLFTGSNDPGVVSVNGGRGRANNYQVNGGSANDVFVNLPAIQPSPDAIEEFRIITNTFDAEFGRNSGAVVNVVTKSGTNNLHGDFYEFFRNKVLNSRNFFDTTKGDFKQNQFGATLGGPIKKDKTFIFGSYEGRRIVSGVSSGTVLLPTAGELTGDFSKLPDGTAASPFSGTLANSSILANRPGCATAITTAGGTLADGTPYTSVFPNNQIPTVCFDLTAKDLSSLFPTANGGQNVFTSNPSDHSKGDQFTVRFDQKLTSAQQLSVYYYFDDSTDNQPFSFFQAAGANIPGFGAQFASRFQQLNASHTWTIGSTAVNEARFTYFREAQGKNDQPAHVSKDGTVHTTCPTIDAAHCFSDPATPGAGITTTLPGHAGLPFISISGGAVIGNNFEGELPQVGNVYQWTDNFSKVKGNHSFKFGGDVSRAHFVQNLFFEVNGFFTFNSNAGTPSGNDLGFSDAYGNYLLGLPTSYGQGAAQTEDVLTNSVYLYAQDSWKIKTNLTLNYGVRWELNTPYNETGHRVQTFRPGQADTIFPCALSPTYPSGQPNPTFSTVAVGGSTDCSPTGPSRAVYPLGLVIPGDKGVPNGLTQTYYKSFAPRLGLAWSPGATTGWLSKLTGGPGKTSIRMGAGMFYNPIEQLVLEQFSAEPPFGGSVLLSGTQFNLPFAFQSGGFAPNPFGGILTPVRSQPVDWSIFRPLLLFGEFQPKMRSQYSEQYNFTIQRQLAKDLLFQIGYVGTQAHRLLQTRELNPGQAQPCLDLANMPGVLNFPGGPALTCGPFSADAEFFVPPGTTIPAQGLHLPYNAASGGPKFIPGGTVVGANGITLVGLRSYSSPFCQPLTGTDCPADGVPVFGSIFAQDTVGSSNYNSLQVLLQKQMSRGLQFQAAYTFSKSIDSASSFESIVNYLDPRKSRSLSAFDARHRFVFSPYWELPIPTYQGFLGKVVNGWAVSGIITFQTGFPIRIVSGNDTELGNSFDFEPVGEPNIVAPIRFIDPRKDPNHQFFDPASFADAPLGQFGNAPRTLCCGPRISQSDISIEKKTRLSERFNTEFRAEFFNAWNHTQFLTPDGNFTNNGSTFGTVQKARDPRQIQFALKVLF